MYYFKTNKNISLIIMILSLFILTHFINNSYAQLDLTQDKERAFLQEKVKGYTIVSKGSASNYNEAGEQAKNQAVLQFADSILFSKDAKKELTKYANDVLKSRDDYIIFYQYDNKYKSGNDKIVEMTLILDKDKIYQKLLELGLIKKDGEIMKAKDIPYQKILIFPTNRLIADDNYKNILQTLADNIKEEFIHPYTRKEIDPRNSIFKIFKGEEEFKDLAITNELVINSKNLNIQTITKNARTLVEQQKINEDYDIWILPVIDKLGEKEQWNEIDFFKTQVKIQAYNKKNEEIFSATNEIEIYFLNPMDKDPLHRYSITGAGFDMIRNLLHSVYEYLEKDVYPLKK